MEFNLKDLTNAEFKPFGNVEDFEIKDNFRIIKKFNLKYININLKNNE